MTLGELARFLAARMKEEQGLAVDLQVVAMQGYRRDRGFEATGLDWVPPSPNLRRLAGLRLYPGVAWLEGANVSVGRGTGQPFEWIGAPWIDGPSLAQAIADERLPGLQVQASTFVPEAAPYAGRRCDGVAFRITDPERFDATLLGAALVRALQRRHPGVFQVERTLGMVGDAGTLQQLREGRPLAELQARWARDSAEFLRRREAALLYR
jgi:uncharacterized protein YbbC (DUF1343 family)